MHMLAAADLERALRATECAIPGRHVLRAKLTLLGMALAGAAHAASDDLTTLNLGDLLQLKVIGATKYAQAQNEVAAAVSILTRQEIRAFGWRTIDEALASLPGVYQTYDRQYTYLGTRGFGVPGDYNTRLLVTVNGNRVNDPAYDGGPMGRQLPLDLALIERIEYIPGPGGALYGQNAMFGVVNIVTRQGAELQGLEAAVAAQQPQSAREGRVSWGRSFSGGLDVLLSASSMRASGEDRFYTFGASGIAGVAKGLDGERTQQFFARVAHGGWSFEYVFGDWTKEDPTGAYLSDPLVAGQSQGDRYSLAQAGYEAELADEVRLQARLFWGREQYSSRLRYGTEFAFPGRSDWRGLEVRLLSTRLTDHKLMLGFEAQDNTRVDQYIQDLALPQNDILIRSPGYRYGLFVHDEWRLAEGVTATMGLRADRNDITRTSVSPRLGLIWQAGATTTFKTLYGQAHRAPNAYERDYDDGFAQISNPALGGERIDTLEFVLDHLLRRDFALRATVYKWDLHDLITLGLDPASGLPQYQSGGVTRAHGAELSADRTWAQGARLRSSVSLQDVEDSHGQRLLNSPRWLARLNLSGPLPWAGLRAGYEWRYDGRRLSRDGSWLGGHAVSNLNLRTESIVPGVQFTLGIYNLFDKRFSHPGADTNWQNAIEQDGRAVQLSLNFRL